MDGIIADYRTEDEKILADAAKIADKFKVPMFYLRIPKKHGLKRTIEGDLKILERCKDVLMISRFQKRTQKKENSYHKKITMCKKCTHTILNDENKKKNYETLGFYYCKCFQNKKENSTRSSGTRRKRPKPKPRPRIR